MAGGAAVLAAVVLASLTVPTSPSTPSVEITPRTATVLPNRNITILCRVGLPIFYCRFEIPGEITRILMPDSSDGSGFSYFGAGLNTGQCGVKIENIKTKHNGELKCSMGMKNITHEAEAKMKLTVAQSPLPPELQVDLGPRGNYDYSEEYQLKASCKIPNGRPVANISWYLGDSLVRDGITMPPTVEETKPNLFTVSQNFSKILSWRDNAKSLKCYASHLAYPNGFEKSLIQITVEFRPKPMQQSSGVQQQDVENSKAKLIILELYANPKPQIKWKLSNGEEIREGRQDSIGNFKVQNTIDKGSGKWETRLLITSPTDEILKADYQVLAENRLGKEVYHISLKPSILSEVINMGTGPIVGIVVAVVVIIGAIFLLIFARATGRWCFAASGNPTRNEKESESLTGTALERDLNTGDLGTGYCPTNCMLANGEQTNQRSDTESADQGPLSGQKKKSGFQFPKFFKKKDKVSADPECLKVSLTDRKNVNESTKVPATNPDGIVYAELDLQAVRRPVVVRSEDEKTEYAEIIHNPKRDDEPVKEISE